MIVLGLLNYQDIFTQLTTFEGVLTCCPRTLELPGHFHSINNIWGGTDLLSSDFLNYQDIFIHLKGRAGHWKKIFIRDNDNATTPRQRKRASGTRKHLTNVKDSVSKWSGLKTWSRCHVRVVACPALKRDHGTPLMVLSWGGTDLLSSDFLK